jgi:hypothetical protein
MVQVTPASESLRCLEIRKAEIATKPSLGNKVAGVDRKSKLKDARNVPTILTHDLAVRQIK